MPRENLIISGVNMPVRGQREIDDRVVLIGFRKDNQVSIYCGEDPVFQFNAAFELRRCYFDGRKLAAKNGQLCLLDRDPNVDEIHLRSEPIDSKSFEEIVQQWNRWKSKIGQSSSFEWTVVGCELAEFQQRIMQLVDHPHPITIAQSPNA